MTRVVSEDGTPIAYERSGTGSPLLLVHGTTTDHALWDAVKELLGARHTVYALDRRGRLESGDADTWSFEREIADIDAVLGEIPGRATLLGHSFGAICALEAALRGASIERLVLYEPPVSPQPLPIPRESLDHLDDALQAGHPEEVVTSFFRDIERVPEGELEGLRQSPSWERRVDAAGTVPRELRSALDYRLDAAKLRTLQVPTLLLLGGDSPPFLSAGTRAIAEALPNATVQTLDGQKHSAMVSNPQLFANAVLGFA